MRKPVYVISAQSDQRLCCSLPSWYDSSSFYSRNFKPLCSFCGCAGWFESYLIANPDDRFSRDMAYFMYAVWCRYFSGI